MLKMRYPWMLEKPSIYAEKYFNIWVVCSIIPGKEAGGVRVRKNLNELKIKKNKSKSGRKLWV